jgi:hypothetical protein
MASANFEIGVFGLPPIPRFVVGVDVGVAAQVVGIEVGEIDPLAPVVFLAQRREAARVRADQLPRLLSNRQIVQLFEVGLRPLGEVDQRDLLPRRAGIVHQLAEMGGRDRVQRHAVAVAEVEVEIGVEPVARLFDVGVGDPRLVLRPGNPPGPDWRAAGWLGGIAARRRLLRGGGRSVG